MQVTNNSKAERDINLKRDGQLETIRLLPGIPTDIDEDFLSEVIAKSVVVAHWIRCGDLTITDDDGDEVEIMDVEEAEEPATPTTEGSATSTAGPKANGKKGKAGKAGKNGKKRKKATAAK